MGKASLPKTPINDTLDANRERKKQFGRERSSFSGISSITTSIGSGVNSTGNIEQQVIGLSTGGGTMTGPIAFHPKTATISNGTINLEQTEAYSSRIIVNGQGSTSDDLEVILNASHAGQILFFQPVTVGHTITLQDFAKTATAWATGTSYSIGDVRLSGSRRYTCYVAHTSSASTQPTTGADWSDKWHRNNIHIPGDTEKVVQANEIILLQYDQSSTATWILVSGGSGSGMDNPATTDLNMAQWDINTLDRLLFDQTNGSSLSSTQSGITSDLGGGMNFNVKSLQSYNFHVNGESTPSLQINNNTVVSESIYPNTSSESLGASGVPWLSSHITTGNFDDIVIGGATKGISNIGTLSLINNTQTPSTDGTIYASTISGNLHVFVRTNGTTKDLGDIGTGGSGANQNLSNLNSPTAINMPLFPSSAHTGLLDIGSATNRWQDIYLTGQVNTTGALSVGTTSVFVGIASHFANIIMGTNDIQQIQNLEFSNNLSTPSTNGTIYAQDISGVRRVFVRTGGATKDLTDIGTGGSGGGANTSLNNLSSPTLNTNINANSKNINTLSYIRFNPSGIITTGVEGQMWYDGTNFKASTSTGSSFIIGSGGSSWNGNATGNLDMNGNNIDDAGTVQIDTLSSAASAIYMNKQLSMSSSAYINFNSSSSNGNGTQRSKPSSTCEGYFFVKVGNAVKKVAYYS